MRERLTSYWVSIKKSWKTSAIFAQYGGITFAFTLIITSNSNSIENYTEGNLQWVINTIGWYLYYVLLIGVICGILAFIPSIVGGAIIYRFSMKDIQKNNFSPKPSFWRGVVLGASSTIIITTPVLMFYWYLSQISTHILSFSIFIINAVIAIIIGSIVGGLAGKKIHKQNILESQSQPG